MDVGICTNYDFVGTKANDEIDAWKMLQWGFIRNHFSIGPHWVRELPTDYVPQYKLGTVPIGIESLEELPDWPLVVLSAANVAAKYLKGTENIVTFVHPPKAIYYFGSDRGHLTQDKHFADRQPDHLVYIPANKYPMHSHIAGGIVFYDRMLKNG